jgi:hypothetical protein
LQKKEQMAMKKSERTMINAHIATRDRLKLAAARLGVPMYRLLDALSAYALTLDSLPKTETVNHKNTEHE